MGVERDGLAVETDRLEADFGVARDLTEELRQREAALPV